MRPLPDLRHRGLIAGGIACATSYAGAQQFPTRPVRLLVGFPPGGGVDVVARLLSARLPAILGQSVIVENLTGASGSIAAAAVSRSAPDGYTLLMGEAGMLIAPHLNPKLNFDPLQSFTPVAGAFQTPLMIVAHDAVNVSGPREFLALLKAKPGQYSYATPGVGTVQHLAMEVVKARTATFILHIPYRGAAQIVPDVISGEVSFAVLTVAAAMQQVRNGRLKAIAMLSAVRPPGTEGVPAMGDALPGFDVAVRIFVLAPAGTPASIRDRLSDAMRAVLSSDELSQAAAQQGAITTYLPSAALASELVAQSSVWQRVIM